MFRSLICLDERIQQSVTVVKLKWSWDLSNSERSRIAVGRVFTPYLVDFTRLQTLQIWNCDNADALLDGLKELAQQQRLRLHGLVLSFEMFEPSTINAIQILVLEIEVM